GGARAAPANDECDRERVRDGAAADGEDEGNGKPASMPDDGLQADGVGVAELAGLERLPTPGRCHQGSCIRGWGSGRGRRLMTSASTTIDNIPPAGAALHDFDLSLCNDLRAKFRDHFDHPGFLQILEEGLPAPLLAYLTEYLGENWLLFSDIELVKLED